MMIRTSAINALGFFCIFRFLFFLLDHLVGSFNSLLDNQLSWQCHCWVLQNTCQIVEIEDMNFTKKNSCGKNHGRTKGGYHYMRRVTGRYVYNETLALTLRSTGVYL